MSELMRKAQMYRDLGYASRFKFRHPLHPWYRLHRYNAARLDAQYEHQDESPIRRTVYERLPDRIYPLFPRWAYR